MYDWTVNILEDVKSTDGRSLLDTLRVMIFVDGVKTIYGKPLSSTYRTDSEGNPDYRPPISVGESEGTATFPFMGYVDDTFASSEVITTFRGEYIAAGQMKRYTFVTWLEGFRSSNSQTAPVGANVKLGVEINAYENQ